MFYKDTEAEICKIFCDDILGINRDWEFKKNTTLCFENLYTQHEMCFLVKNYKILPSLNGKQTSQKATKIALVVYSTHNNLSVRCDFCNNCVIWGFNAFRLAPKLLSRHADPKLIQVKKCHTL